MIEDYGYLNARVRGMSTRLLAGEVYPALLDTGDLESFAARLSEAPNYRREIERERADAGGLDIHAVEAALLAAYAEDVRKVRQIGAGRPRALVDIFLSRYDLHNVRTLVRGVLRGRPADQIRRGTLPLGAFTKADLEELAAAGDLPALAATLVTWGMPFGEVLRGLLRQYSGEGDLLRFDSALDGAWYPWAIARATAIGGGEDLAATLAAEVDLRNIVSLLKLARQGAEAAHAREFIIEGGTLKRRLLAEIAEAQDLRAALDVVGRTRYGEALGGVDFGGTATVSAVERLVERLLVRNFSRLFRKDPLGFPTMLGYLWRRHAEFTDLRLIARGQGYGLPAAEVRAQMVHA